MFNRRLQKLVNPPGSPLLGGAMDTDEERDAALTSPQSRSLPRTVPGKTRSAPPSRKSAARRSTASPPTELKTQITRYERCPECRLAEQEDTRANQSLANAIL